MSQSIYGKSETRYWENSAECYVYFFNFLKIYHIEFTYIYFVEMVTLEKVENTFNVFRSTYTSRISFQSRKYF